MRITSVDVIPVAGDWSGDPGWTGQHVMSAVLIRVVSDGESGLGETMLGYFAPDVVGSIVDFYRPLLIGEDPLNIEDLWRRLFQSSVYWGRTGAAMSVLSGIEMALWDLKGRHLGVPVWQLLGGLSRDRIRVYASGGGSVWPFEETLAKVKIYEGLGYRAAKVGTGFSIRPPVGDASVTAWQRTPPPSTAAIAELEGEKFRVLREGMGRDFELAVDGHQGARAYPYGLTHALRIAQALEPLGLLFFEEPLSYLDRRQYAQLRARTTVPIAGGESLSGIHEFNDYIDSEALDMVQPDISYVGGIGVTRLILDQAGERGLSAAIHTGGAVGPAFAASLHLSVAHPSAIILEQVPAAAPVQRALISDSLDIVDGCLAAPTAPGLGVELSEEYIGTHPVPSGHAERTRWIFDR